jgi:hypothetical protein
MNERKAARSRALMSAMPEITKTGPVSASPTPYFAIASKSYFDPFTLHIYAALAQQERRMTAPSRGSQPPRRAVWCSTMPPCAANRDAALDRAETVRPVSAELASGHVGAQARRRRAVAPWLTRFPRCL